MLGKSEIIVYRMIQYFRYKRQVFDFGIETPVCGGYFADLALKDRKTEKNHLWEIEVKISYSDFINDFKKKYTKHKILNDPSPFYKDVPNKFSFAIPSEATWIEKARDYLKENYPKYGLIVVDLKGHLGNTFDNDLAIARSAKVLHDMHQNYDLSMPDIVYMTRRMLKFHFMTENRIAESN